MRKKWALIDQDNVLISYCQSEGDVEVPWDCDLLPLRYVYDEQKQAFFPILQHFTYSLEEHRYEPA